MSPPPAPADAGTSGRRRPSAPAPDLPEVRLIRITPDPEEVICIAARGDYYPGFVADQPFSKVMEPIEGDTLDDKKRKLIGLLMKRGHFGPFEHVATTWAIRGMSRACMAQITRHRIASFDIQSQRYVDFGDQTPDDMCWPPSFSAEEVKAREGGRHVIEMPADERKERVGEHYANAIALYNDLVEAGVPKEDARMVLPLGSRVNGTMTVNARALMHVLDMRLAGDAQWEVRHLSQQMLDQAEKEMPITFGLYKELLHMRKNRLAP